MFALMVEDVPDGVVPDVGVLLITAPAGAVSRFTGVAWLEVLVDIGVLVLASGAFFVLWSPIASALPAANARMEVVRNMGASLRMVCVSCVCGGFGMCWKNLLET